VLSENKCALDCRFSYLPRYDALWSDRSLRKFRWDVLPPIPESEPKNVASNNSSIVVAGSVYSDVA
jgi:hypothetical protein